MSTEGDAQPLNVLLITCDQWRADCLSAAGHPVLKTPHLDSLGPCTQLPSFTQCLSGLHSENS
jgi:membrane-anchored protein YejM (alkaline phosphatase superfamily)